MSKQTSESCKAHLYIHTHCETNEPMVIEVQDWNGPVDLLDYLKKESNISDFDIGVSVEAWQRAIVNFDSDDGRDFAVSIRPMKRKKKVPPSKLTVKRSSEATVIESDRGRLLDSANELISSLNLKQIAPILNSGIATQIELSAEEKKAYESALSYLARQFDAGHKDMETVVTKKESERTVEHKVE